MCAQCCCLRLCARVCCAIFVLIVPLRQAPLTRVCALASAVPGCRVCCLHRPYTMNGNDTACIILHHIPKSAGTSIMQWCLKHRVPFWTHYGPGLRMGEPAPRSDRSHYAITEAHIFMGHFAAGVMSNGDSFRKYVEMKTASQCRSWHSWTILREPVARVVSAIQFHHQNLSCVTDVSCRSHLEYNNDMCRMFTASSAHWNHFEAQYSKQPRNMTCNSSDAIAELRKMDGIGFSEALHHTINEWERLLGIPSSSQRAVPCHNNGRHEEAASWVPLIEQRNQDDIDVYNTMYRERCWTHPMCRSLTHDAKNASHHCMWRRMA